MNQFKEWGFSTAWWRGERGEYWVIGQLILFIAFILLPVSPVITREQPSLLWQYSSWGLAGFFGLVAMGLLVGGVLKLGNNLTPLPHPKDDGELVTIGVYSIVRHPIYSGVIFAAIAYSCWQWSLSHAIGAMIFLLFFDQKAKQEESWLQTKFPDYASYQSRVKKLIPWIY
ncbi:methyltransferase family protein [Alkalinema pantanalense CENA528]|uniref:methyltransferase family protein n=1 Tax=Alkalinema pantanalense TaxID=1620705 RepID=UPI003D6FC189